MKKIKPVKALAIVGPDNVIGTLTDRLAVHTGRLAIYEYGSRYDKRIMKNYKLRIIEVLISPLPKKGKVKR